MKEINIDGVSALLIGEPKSKVYLFIHGKLGNKEEAIPFFEIVKKYGYQVLSIELPEHGTRKDSKEKLVPWDVIPELKKVIEFVSNRWSEINLYAVSIGAWFSMLSFKNIHFNRTIFVSPVVDMKKLIQNMMVWQGVSLKDLEDKKEIPTDFGEILSYKYYQFALKNPVSWSSNTFILYGDKDNLTSLDTIKDFSLKNKCTLKILHGYEHYIKVEKQLDFIEPIIKD